jgi:lipoyl(octanoyl) transferase
MRIDDIGSYLRAMEAAIVSALAQEGVHARSRCSEGPDFTGVWVEERKIASIGLHVSRGVSTHGFAVNVNNQLEPFRWVVACGLPGVSMTSVAQELGSSRAVSPERFRSVMAERFCHALGREQRLVSPARLGIEGRAARSPAPEAAIPA